jgi:hypothetical protein
VRSGKSYAAALDILHAEALAEDEHRFHTSTPGAECAPNCPHYTEPAYGPIDRAAILRRKPIASLLYSGAADGPVAAAAARTGSVGARTLLTRDESALLAEGQALAAVAQAARAAGCPPLCDASAVLHIVVRRTTGDTPPEWAGLRGMDAWPSWPIGVPHRGGLCDATTVTTLHLRVMQAMSDAEWIFYQRGSSVALVHSPSGRYVPPFPV